MRQRLIQPLAAVIAAAMVAATPTTALAGDVDVAKYCFGNATSGQTACTNDAAAIDTTKSSIGIGAATSAGRSATASVLVARLWSSTNGTGSSFDIYAAAACNTGSGLDWQFGSLPTFNDVTSSFYGYASCKVKIFADANYGGTFLGPLASSSYVGASMNDLTSSVQGY